MIYGLRNNGLQHGLVLTKKEVVKAMLDLSNYVSTKNLNQLSVIDPAAGTGAFALEILERLYQSSLKFNFDFKTTLYHLHFFELDDKMAKELQKNIALFLKNIGIKNEKPFVYVGDFLQSHLSGIDLIIGNPPYVRHENIPKHQKQIYRQIYATFKYRSDLYIPFYEKGLKSLATNGQLCFICSNRWLKNQYGELLRKLIYNQFHLKQVIDLEKTNPFQELVTAYPAITLIQNIKQKTATSFYKIENLEQLPKIISNQSVSEKRQLLKNGDWQFLQDSKNQLIKCLDYIEQQGFKIGIGVATGADKVFIRKSINHEIEEDLLLPLLTSKDVKNDIFNWKKTFLINPFTTNGKLINLEHYPKAKSFFKEHELVLKKRYIARKNPLHWYKTIDRIDVKLVQQAKIILPDVSGNKFIFIDKGQFYPHHNLYYITGNNLHQLKILAAILLSDFTRFQLNNIGHKMNGGYVRWQSQYLRKLKIPIINTFPKHFQNAIIDAYDKQNILIINKLITAKNINGFKYTKGQLSLFETST